MRVVVMGQAAFGEAVFRRLREDGFDVAGVSAPAPAGGREDPLWAAASSAGVPVIETRRLKEAEGQEAWAALRPDLCVMAFVTEIIPHEVLELPRLGSIQYHPSLLPLHRGSSAINWAIIFRRTETGLTIFWPDRGIDTGPILLQRSCPIGPDDTVGSVYFERLFPMGVDAMAEAAALVRDGKAPRIAQDHAKATYEPPCRDEHAAIRWHEPADRLYALIRGCNPQPGAWTTFEGQRLRIFDCRLTGEEEPGMPGRVLRVEEGSFDVRLNGGVLRVLRVQPEGGKKVGAGEWAREAGVAAGYRFR
ncbi:methionyl-tRNA formyltransferase [Tepidiforma flava]|uniref:Methionyl-tRNA formyltransferase n=1 Tax=Tepidiforma flava TaxID=3004094 RepID=A0ABY7MCB9_9CHLR|nr:methionyl-tRNA formyltransferase [Tepidiforma flava]WBL37570.1 methionyl-tRNA formyltransferase [Tepidiforma flava]